MPKTPGNFRLGMLLLAQKDEILALIPHESRPPPPRQRGRRKPEDDRIKNDHDGQYVERRQHSPDMNERSHLGQLIRRREFIASLMAIGASTRTDFKIRWNG